MLVSAAGSQFLGGQGLCVGTNQVGLLGEPKCMLQMLVNAGTSKAMPAGESAVP